ncbi:MAG: serine/threonine protein kinase [Chloroflexia bacterium]|nr:serine/threonine protein kinase [Chloroflexia bacterium]
MSPIHPTDTLLGGRYALVRPIARGGMATVFKAWDHCLQRTVAIKILHPTYATDSAACAHFLNEAYMTATLNHRNVIAIYDYGAEGRHHYIVMEYLPGGTIKDDLDQSGAFPVPVALDLAIQIADGLAEAHHHGIVHGDVKPANILLTEDGCAKVADFGVSRQLHLTMTTAPGLCFGTPDYVAPEVIKTQKAIPASDVYALGVTLYELLTGYTPFTGETTEELIGEHLMVEPIPVSRYVPDLPKKLDQLILRMLAKDPTQRYPDAATLAVELRHVHRKRRTHPTKCAMLVTLNLILFVILLGWLFIQSPTLRTVRPNGLRSDHSRPSPVAGFRATLEPVACPQSEDPDYGLPGSNHSSHEIWFVDSQAWYRIRIERLATDSSRSPTSTIRGAGVSTGSPRKARTISESCQPSRAAFSASRMPWSLA